MSRGEIWWNDDPYTGRRPYLILTRDDAIPVLNQVLGVPATRTIRGISTEVQLDRSDGMPDACVLAIDNTGPIRVSLCTERITRLSLERMQAVCDALALAIAC